MKTGAGVNAGMLLLAGLLVACGGGGFSTTDGGSDGGGDGGVPWRPARPQEVANLLESTVNYDIFTASRFLYEQGLVQQGVEPGTIEPRRVAVVRGRVIDETGEALSGVRVEVVEHEELGWTLTRSDGRFDLAVNGGGRLQLGFSHDGYFTARRRLAVPWRDYVTIEDLVLVAKPPVLATVSPGVGALVQADAVSDDDGLRRATLVFSSGTNWATLVFSSGTN